MSDTSDDTQRHALVLLTVILLLVVAGVVAYGVSRGLSPASTATGMPGVATPADTAFALPETLYFTPDSDLLPVDASESLERVAELARGKAGTEVVVTPFHDAHAAGVFAFELALRRAQVVKHALEANGVASDSISVRQPEPVASDDIRVLHRVELSLR